MPAAWWFIGIVCWLVVSAITITWLVREMSKAVKRYLAEEESKPEPDYTNVVFLHDTPWGKVNDNRRKDSNSL